MSIPKNKMFYLPAALTRLNLCPFLDDLNLTSLSRTCTFYRDALINPRADRKAAKLLFYVVNPHKANLKQMQKLFSVQKEKAQSIILIRVSGLEVYFSKKQGTWVSRRKWTNVSPLEAAALCGDIHLVRWLLAKIPVEQRREALAQLLAVQKQRTSDEPGSYICVFPDFWKAYKKYKESFPALISTGRYDEINKLWGHIGEVQTSLPWFLLQVLCDPIPHLPIPDFTKEPKRVCHLGGGYELDLDALRFNANSGVAIFKHPDRPSEANLTGYNMDRTAHECDFLAIKRLCEVLPIELDKTIQWLLKALESQADADGDKPLHPGVVLCKKIVKHLFRNA